MRFALVSACAFSYSSLFARPGPHKWDEKSPMCYKVTSPNFSIAMVLTMPIAAGFALAVMERESANRQLDQLAVDLNDFLIQFARTANE